MCLSNTSNSGPYAKRYDAKFIFQRSVVCSVVFIKSLAHLGIIIA